MFNLHKYIPSEALPRELGGDLDVVDKSWLYNALLEREQKQEQHKQLRVRTRSKYVY